LKDKFDNTKAQVVEIVQNFGKIHSDLQELKREYLQEQAQMSSLVQMGSSISTAQLSESDVKVSELQQQLSLKKQQMMSLAESFGKMHSSLSDIKQRFTDDKRGSLV